LLNLAGKDCTDPFLVMHPSWVIDQKLKYFSIGKLKDFKLTPMQQDFHEMRKKIIEEGLEQTNYWYYAKKLACQCILLSLSVAILIMGSRFCLASSSSSPLLSSSSISSFDISSNLFPVRWLTMCITNGWTYRLLSAILLGTFWQQMAFWGHDFGHHSITHIHSWDRLGGLVVTLFFGVSGSWWRRSHNVHHLVTNSIHYDPDIQYLPFFAVSTRMFNGFFSFYHGRMFKFDKLSRTIISYQHILYYPLLAVARFNLYLQSFLTVLDPRIPIDLRYRLCELSALLLFNFSYAYLILSYLPDWKSRMLYTLMCHGLCGVLHVQITLSHFCLDAYDGGYEGSDYFINCQFQRTMDISSPPSLDWFHGGLNFQVEHHLFPRLPRHTLRYIKEKYVLPFVNKHQLPYQSYPFFEANLLVYARLRAVAQEAGSLSSSAKPQINFLPSLLNADG